MTFTLLTISFEIICGFIYSYCLISVIEWYIHKYHLHKNGWINKFEPLLYTDHQKIHHPNYKESFEEPRWKNLADIGIKIKIREILPIVLPLSFILYFFSIPTAIIFFLLGISYPIIWSAFHEEMHSSKNKWFSKLKWYKKCLQHHKIHHEYPTKNYCVLFFFADRLFGTYKWQL